DAGKARYSFLGRRAANLEAVSQGLGNPALRRVDDGVDEAILDHIDDVWMSFFDTFWHLLNREVHRPDHGGRAGCGAQPVSRGCKVADEAQRLRLRAISEAQEYGAVAGEDLEDVDVGWRSFGAFRFRSHDHVLDVH